MIFSKKRTLKALIIRHGCAGWSAPLLFSKTEYRLSHVEAHLHFMSLMSFPIVSLVIIKVYLIIDCLCNEFSKLIKQILIVKINHWNGNIAHLKDQSEMRVVVFWLRSLLSKDRKIFSSVTI